MRARRALLSLIILILFVVATAIDFMLCATMLSYALDTHDKTDLLCTVFGFILFIWVCGDGVRICRNTSKEIKEYLSFRFQKDKDGFEKEDCCEPKRKTSNKYKKGE